MADETPDEPIFRANKRRRVIRKRSISDPLEESFTRSEAPAENADALITKHGSESEEDGASALMRVQKKGGVRKHGIGFSKADGRQHGKQQQNEETALVPGRQDEAETPAQNDRFVKPTGRVGMAEDKHMTAFVDSKLAEMRSSSAMPADMQTPSQSANKNPEREGVDYEATRADMDSKSPELATNTTSSGRTWQQAQARSTRVYQRPTKRRPPPVREENDIARDSMIDQIMREHQVPLYERSVPTTQVDNGDDGDNDTAAADAFKAQLLADMETNRRRPPLSSKNATAASTGPKLGGSRSQREKMKALDEAKAKEGKK